MMWNMLVTAQGKNIKSNKRETLYWKVILTIKVKKMLFNKMINYYNL